MRDRKMTDPTRDLFGTLASVLLRCAIIGYLLLLISFGIYMFAGDAIYKLNSMFGLSKHEMDLIFYICLVVIKLIVLMFFLIPWIAIRLVMRAYSLPLVARR